LFRVFDADKDDRIIITEVRRMFAAADEMKDRSHDQQASYCISCFVAVT
jgi:Ca2+-binding EF-hand superfamily protein